MRHPHYTQSRSLASNVIMESIASLFDPFPFMDTTLQEWWILSEIPSLALVAVIITDKQETSSAQIFLQECLVLLFLQIVVILRSRGESLKYAPDMSMTTSKFYKLKNSTKTRTLKHCISKITLSGISNSALKVYWPSRWGIRPSGFLKDLHKDNFHIYLLE